MSFIQLEQVLAIFKHHGIANNSYMQ